MQNPFCFTTNGNNTTNCKKKTKKDRRNHSLSKETDKNATKAYLLSIVSNGMKQNLANFYPLATSARCILHAFTTAVCRDFN